jgi:membrane-bound lytic murein transglycosylase D
VEPAPFKAEPAQAAAPSNSTRVYSSYRLSNSYPRISGNTTKANQPNQITVNELPGVQASGDMTPDQFADEIGMKGKKFRKLNDLQEDELIETGRYYYTQKKRTSAEVESHIVQPGETLWWISQKYGIRLSALKSKNRIRKDSELKPGMVLTLQEPRKRGEEIPVIPVSSPETASAPVNVQSEPVRVEPRTDQSKDQPDQGGTVYHTVSRGETLFSISKKYGVTVEEVKKWNNIGVQNIITIGQKLVILRP